MPEYSVAEARDQLSRLVHEAEARQVIHLTRRGRPVAVLLSEEEYARLQSRQPAPPSLTAAIAAWRQEAGEEGVDLCADEVSAWRDRDPGRSACWKP